MMTSRTVDWADGRLLENAVSSASVVALHLVIARSIPSMRAAISDCEIQTSAWQSGIFSNSPFIPLLSFPRAMIHSYLLLHQNSVMIFSNIVRDH